MVEKIRSKTANFEDILNQMYFDFKIRKKLTEEEILNKTKSLRSSMYLFDQETTESLFEQTNFNYPRYEYLMVIMNVESCCFVCI